MEKVNKTRHGSYFNIETVPITSIQPELLQKRVSSTNRMIDDLIADYRGNEKADTGYKRLIKIDAVVKEIFDELNQSPLKNSEAQLLSDLCKRLNEDYVLQEIRDTHLDERLTGENVCILPSINAQKMSSLPGSPVKRSARIGHSRTTLDFIQPKKALHEIPMIHYEDLSPSSRLTQQTQQDQNDRYGYVDPEEVKKTAEIKLMTIQKLDEEIKELVNHSLTRLDTRRGNECETIPAQTEEEMNRCIQEEKRKYIENLFVQMKKEFENHRIEFSHKYFTEIQEAKQSADYSQQRAYIAQKMTENAVLMDDIDYTYKEVLKIIAELEDENGYEIEKAKKNVTIKYKNLPGGGVSLKLEAVVDVPLFNLLALNYEAEGFAQWTPFCKESKLLKRLSRASNAMWMKWDMPPPVSSREGYLIGSGFDRLDINGSILMIAKTIHNDPRLAARHGIDIPAKSKYVKMEIPYIGTDLVPVSKTQTKMRLVTTFDPQIKFVPLSLSSWIARKGSIYLLETMVKHAQTLEGAQWKIYLERSKDFYGWLEGLLKGHPNC